MILKIKNNLIIYFQNKTGWHILCHLVFLIGIKIMRAWNYIKMRNFTIFVRNKFVLKLYDRKINNHFILKYAFIMVHYIL
ncbi:MAG: hypothetical protein ACI8WT_003967 [Clostridium sp.]|jgi:hypothetical protein